MPQAGDLAINAGRFPRHNCAVGLSPRTERTFLEPVETMVRFLPEPGSRSSPVRSSDEREQSGPRR
jgi:hypothetical protein